MSAILPSIQFDRTEFLAQYFMPHQLAWIYAEDHYMDKGGVIHSYGAYA